MDTFSRVENLIGLSTLNKLKNSHVAVFGVGGVGGFVVEALVRSGIGKITVFDNDTINYSNLNRQVIATLDNIGKSKVDEIEKRAKSINPDVIISKNQVFYLPENADKYPFTDYDYVVDAVDTVSAKIAIIEQAKRQNVKVISSMGTGGKLSPTMLKVDDIKNTTICPLARVMRRELKKRNIEGVKVVYSVEEPIKPKNDKESIPSMIFVPSCAGIIIASEVVKDLIGEK